MQQCIGLSTLAKRRRAALKGCAIDESLADVTKEPASAAVARILQLHQQTIGIGEVELRRSAGRAAAILHAHGDVMTHRADRALRAFARLDADALERLH